MDLYQSVTACKGKTFDHLLALCRSQHFEIIFQYIDDVACPIGWRHETKRELCPEESDCGSLSTSYAFEMRITTPQKFAFHGATYVNGMNIASDYQTIYQTAKTYVYEHPELCTISALWRYVDDESIAYDGPSLFD